MTPLIQQIAELLAKHGSLSTRELGTMMKESPERLGSAVQHVSSRARYGIRYEGKVTDGSRGGPSNLWSVDARVLRRYLAARGPYRAPVKPRAPKVPKSPRVAKAAPAQVLAPVAEARKPFVYTGPILTRWLPCSPYAKALE